MKERRADMIAGERNAAQSATRNQDHYFLQLEVKNVGTNTIKSMIWEYQPSARTAAHDLRQYVCTMKAKPKESKKFELVSPFNPVKVVSAEGKSAKSEGKVVINRIEYTGRINLEAQRLVRSDPRWDDGPDGNGKCVMF